MKTAIESELKINGEELRHLYERVLRALDALDDDNNRRFMEADLWLVHGSEEQPDEH